MHHLKGDLDYSIGKVQFESDKLSKWIIQTDREIVMGEDPEHPEQTLFSIGCQFAQSVNIVESPLLVTGEDLMRGVQLSGHLESFQSKTLTPEVSITKMTPTGGVRMNPRIRLHQIYDQPPSTYKNTIYGNATEKEIDQEIKERSDAMVKGVSDEVHHETIYQTCIKLPIQNFVLNRIYTKMLLVFMSTLWQPGRMFPLVKHIQAFHPLRHVSVNQTRRFTLATLLERILMFLLKESTIEGMSEWWNFEQYGLPHISSVVFLAKRKLSLLGRLVLDCGLLNSCFCRISVIMSTCAQVWNRMLDESAPVEEEQPLMTAKEEELEKQFNATNTTAQPTNTASTSETTETTETKNNTPEKPTRTYPKKPAVSKKLKDKWEVDEDGLRIVRLHTSARQTLFTPAKTKLEDHSDHKLSPDVLSDQRITTVNYLDGESEIITDNWRSKENEQRFLSKKWTGQTAFSIVPEKLRSTLKSKIKPKPGGSNEKGPDEKGPDRPDKKEPEEKEPESPLQENQHILLPENNPLDHDHIADDDFVPLFNDERLHDLNCPVSLPPQTESNSNVTVNAIKIPGPLTVIYDNLNKRLTLLQKAKRHVVDTTDPIDYLATYVLPRRNTCKDEWREYTFIVPQDSSTVTATYPYIFSGSQFKETSDSSKSSQDCLRCPTPVIQENYGDYSKLFCGCECNKKLLDILSETNEEIITDTSKESL
jgi:hypothetical protein